MNTQILIVENEANTADDLETGLREEGYAVKHAAHVVSAWFKRRSQLRGGSGPALTKSLLR